MRKVNTRCQKKSDEFQKKRKPGGSNQAGRPESLKIFQNTLTGGRADRAWTCAKGPSRMATGPGRPASPRPAGPTCRPFPGPLRVLTVCHSYSMFLPGFIQFHSKSCQLKSNKIFEWNDQEELKSFHNHGMLSFISYASTELPPELMFRITGLFAYCFLWYNDMKLC
jgi:hypothetical protein